jgi:histidinol-phosphatase (PHP family)
MIDTHTHSHHSPDGSADMATMALAAESFGLTGITFTEHAEWYPGDEAYGYLDLGAYFSEVAQVRDRYADRVAVFSGIELGNPHDFPDEVRALLSGYPFDLAIGSVHWLDDQPGWKPPVFAPGLDPTYRRYFEEVVRMVEQAEFDVLGHLDLIRRDSWDLCHEVLALAPYRDLIEPALRQLVEDGRGLEVNTSGLRKGLPEPVPGSQILQWYRALGGEILVFGSDGHRPEHVGFGFGVARDLALSAGFEYLTVFRERRVVDWTKL